MAIVVDLRACLTLHGPTESTVDVLRRCSVNGLAGGWRVSVGIAIDHRTRAGRRRQGLWLRALELRGGFAVLRSGEAFRGAALLYITRAS